jgi:hypothetical protein
MNGSQREIETGRIIGEPQAIMTLPQLAFAAVFLDVSV